MTGRPATTLIADGPQPPSGPVLDEHTDRCLSAPPPAMVRAARGYLTSHYAAGVDAVLWEIMEHPLPDLDTTDAVNAASSNAQSGAGDQPEPMEIAAALVVLAAARLEMDQTEARLLNTAQVSGLDWVQIAAILDLSPPAAEERYRQLKPRLDEPIAEILPPHLREEPTHRPRATRPSEGQRSPTSLPVAADPAAAWDEPEDDPCGQP